MFLSVWHPWIALSVLLATSQATNGHYEYLSYQQIIQSLQSLAHDFPDLVRVWNAQNEWNVPSPGDCGGGPNSCQQFFAVITNLNTLEDDPERPEVFFSGSVHGNERVGPTTTVEFAKLMCENYRSGNNSWLKRLVDTRAMYIMPNANALGYYQNVRTENHIDPNRDFPYGQIPRDGARCMQTSAARAINEIYREHLFQLALTFHGGMKAIAYEWGSPNHPRGQDTSPDDGALNPIGQLLKGYASKTYYPCGKLNSIVYPVTGGMEDWAYAASWDTIYTPICRPTTYSTHPYSSNKTTYTDDMLRTFNILIETADMKAPLASSLGSSEEVLKASGSSFDGHIPRNIRLCIAMTDLVQPFIVWMSDDNNELVPNTDFTEASASVPVSFGWDVGGAIHVDSTELIIFPIGEEEACPIKFSEDFMVRIGITRINVEYNIGPTVWNTVLTANPSDGSPYSSLWSPYSRRYNATIVISDIRYARYGVVASAIVDQSWANVPDNAAPHTRAQSHVVKARTIQGYTAENNGHRIIGQQRWFATPRCFNKATEHPPTEDPNMLSPASDTTEYVSSTTIPETADNKDLNTTLPRASTIELTSSTAVLSTTTYVSSTTMPRGTNTDDHISSTLMSDTEISSTLSSTTVRDEYTASDRSSQTADTTDVWTSANVGLESTTIALVAAGSVVILCVGVLLVWRMFRRRSVKYSVIEMTDVPNLSVNSEFDQSSLS